MNQYGSRGPHWLGSTFSRYHASAPAIFSASFKTLAIPIKTIRHFTPQASAKCRTYLRKGLKSATP